MFAWEGCGLVWFMPIGQNMHVTREASSKSNAIHIALRTIADDFAMVGNGDPEIKTIHCSGIE